MQNSTEKTGTRSRIFEIPFIDIRAYVRTLLRVVGESFLGFAVVIRVSSRAVLLFSLIWILTETNKK